MRIPEAKEMVSIFAGAAVALLITVGAAAQTPSSSPAATAPTQATPQPSQNTQPPSSSAPAAQSGTNSGAQAGASTSAPHAGAQQGGASIDDELQLTEDQKQKIAAVVDDENKQISAVRDDNSINMEQKQQKVLQIRQAGTPRIKAILTPEQLQKLAAIQQRMRDQQPQSGQQPPAQSTAPPQR